VVAGTVEAYQRALEWFDESLAARADYLPATAHKAEILALLSIEHNLYEGVADACRLADLAVNEAPNDAAALRAQAACLLAIGKTRKADKVIHQALTAVEGDAYEDADSNYLLALIYLKRRQLDEAIYTLDSAVALYPLHFRAYYLLADAYASKREWGKATKAINEALSLIPEHVGARERAEDYQAQLSGAAREAALVPGMREELGSEMNKKEKGDALVKKIRSAIARRSINEGLGLINDLLKLGTHTSTAYMLKCQLLVGHGAYEAAINACSIARNHSTTAYYYLGAAYEAVGNQEQKKRNYQAYLNAQPNGAFANEVRSILGQTGN
ncbi:MAG: tetratricopeptide repeat protein, partial [Alphaproteobacteria bacterium]